MSQPEGVRVRFIDIVAVVLLVALAALFAAPALFKAKERSHDYVRCKHRLADLGRAAVLYSDDLRFFPHVARLRTLETLERVGEVCANHMLVGSLVGFAPVTWLLPRDSGEERA